MSNTHSLPRPSPGQRWLALILVSLAMFGNYYIYDSLGPVQRSMMEVLGFDDAQFGMFFTAYSVAAVLVLLFGGYLIDRFGTRNTIVVFALICLVAAAMTAFSGNYYTILSGRFLLGLGAEPLIVAATTVLAKWFKGRELSLAFGLNLSIARLGSMSTDLSTGFAAPLYANNNWQDPLWLATAVASISVSAALLYWLQEKRLETRVNLGNADAVDKIDFKHLFVFSRSFWYIVGLCVVFYATVFPFRAFAINYFQQAHGLSLQAAGQLNSLLPLAAIIATPLFGLWVDKAGKRSLFMAVGSLIMLPLFLAVTYLPPGVPVSIPFTHVELPLTLLLVMLLLGGVFSLIPAVMWPSVAYIVNSNRLGSAYALMTFCQQLGVAAVPLVIGSLNVLFSASEANPAGYVGGMWFYTLLAAFGLMFSFLLWRTERGPHAHGLDYPGGSKPEATAEGETRMP
ncbi:MAG: MFS transporter [Pseudomonadota bacterium]|nr:MFS transporter [Pseudomonadota bacterium]